MTIVQTLPPTEDHGVNSLIKRIRGDFVASLLERILVLETLKVEASTSQHPDRALSEMREMAHKIAGVAGTLGFQQLGEMSAKLDAILGSAQSSRQAAAQTWSGIEDVVEDLLDEMEMLLDQAES